MTLLHEATDAKKFDIRMIERIVAKGATISDEVEKQLKKLPDDSENAEWINIETLAGEQQGS